jgi:hypothetical protein
MGTWVWWKHRFFELLAALGMASFIIVISQAVAERQQELVPPTSWLMVNEVFVPDFQHGQDPVLIYDRNILEAFDGFVIVEVQSQTGAGLWITMCSGSTVREFNPGEIIENNTVSWSWFIGNACEVDPGQYRLRVTYTMTRSGWPAKRVFVLSNQFNVGA